MNRTQSCKMVQNKQLLELLKRKKKAESQNPSLSPRQKVSPPRLAKLQSPKQTQQSPSLIPVLSALGPQQTKLKGVSHLRTLNSDRDNYELVITLIHQEKQHIISIGLDQNTTDLYQKLITKMSTMDPQNYEKVKYFQTQTQNYNVDYYLSLNGMPLSVFVNSRTLKLTPIYGDDNYSNSFDDFVIIKCIGVGGFSRVYMVKQRQTGEFYAMKIIEKAFILKNSKEAMVNNERLIMGNLESPFLTKLYCSFETKYYLVFVMDYCSGGELFFHLRKMGPLSEEASKQYFVQLCFAIHYLHQQSVVYRDLKPENILLDIDGYIKLSDFGLSKPNITRDKQTYSFCGSPEYMSPEMLQKRGHNQMLDFYSLGAVLFEFIYGYPPYYDQKVQNIFMSIQNEKLTYPRTVKISSELRNLLESLLAKDQTTRLGMSKGIEEILQHPWLYNFDYTALYQRKMPITYKPSPLAINFNVVEFSKGDREFQQKLQDNLYREKQGKYEKVFPNFEYFPQAQKNLRHQIVEKLKFSHLQAVLYTNTQRSKVKTLSLNTPQLSIIAPKYQSVKNSQFSQSSSTQSFRNPSASKRFTTDYDLQKMLRQHI